MSHRQQPLASAIKYAVLVLGAVLMLLPFEWMVVASLMAPNEIMARPLVWLPAVLQFHNYARLAEAISLGRMYLNSLIVTTAITLGILVSSSLAGYGFAKFQFPGRDILFLMVLATIMIPCQTSCWTPRASTAPANSRFTGASSCRWWAQPSVL